MVLYTCEKCNRTFDQKNNYMKHLKRKTPCTQDTEEPVEYEKPTCNYCKSTFSRIDVLNQHINGGYCKVKRARDNQLEQLLNEMIEIKKQLQELKTENNQYKKENNNYKKIIEQQTNINNQYNIEQTNNYNIIAFGKEEKSFITNEEYKQIIDKGFKAVETHVQKIYCNPNKPENQNIYISNMRDDYILIYDGEQWLLRNKDDILEKIYYDNSDTIELKFKELFNVLPTSSIRKFERFINNRDENETINNIKKDLKLLFYNNRHYIKKLQKQIKK